MLRQIPCELELGDEAVSIAEVSTEISAVELSFFRLDLLYSLREDLVADFFVVEEFGSFGCIVDNVRDL